MVVGSRPSCCFAIAASAGATAVASTPAPHLKHGPVVTFDRKHPSNGLLDNPVLQDLGCVATHR
jgi:hypothetical protein